MNLEKVVSASTLTSAHDCLESGVCGVQSCFSRAVSNTRPTPAHAQLAKDFCAACAPGVASCASQFYAKKSDLPGALVLPFSESIAKAVGESCTTDRESCRSQFASCANETITRLTGEAVDPELAACVTGSLRRDDGNGSGLGGGPTVTTCTPANCTGCCRNDTCEDGKTGDSCGLGAASCQTCSGAQTCTDGSCKEPCGPTNCDGCCNGDVCTSRQETKLCGGGVEGCEDCTKRGASYICSGKQCIDASCQVTCTNGCCTNAGCQDGKTAAACGTGGEGCVRCGTGRTCNATTRSCALDPNGTWNFVVNVAFIPAANKGGGAWDPFSGPPDPYLKAFSSQGASTHTGQTLTLTDTLSPTWAVAVLTNVKASELMNNLSFELWDSDLDFDDFIGGCQVPLTAANFDGGLYTRVCGATSSNVEVRLLFRLTKS